MARSGVLNGTAPAAGEEARSGAPASGRTIVAIGGGKGGSGKTMLAAALGAGLARRGLGVVLVDCDLGGANLHTVLGLEHPGATLSDFVLHRVEDLGALVTPTRTERLGLISGARNAFRMANPLYQQKVRLARAIRRLDADVVILDLGAGTHFNVVDFFLLAEAGVLVVVPEATSVENAYGFLKAAFMRYLRSVNGVGGLKEMVQAALHSRGDRPVSPAELVQALGELDPEAGERVRRHIAGFRPLLVVNQVREPSERGLGEGMVAAVRRVFGVELGHLGTLGYDEEIMTALRRRVPLSSETQGDAFASELEQVIDGLLARRAVKA